MIGRRGGISTEEENHYAGKSGSRDGARSQSRWYKGGWGSCSRLMECKEGGGNRQVWRGRGSACMGNTVL